MIAFRQVIRPGQSGRDVRAVKRTLIQMKTQDSGTLAKTNFAGSAFVHCLKAFQRNHNIKVDGIYGKSTHEKIAPHFDGYSILLYKSAKIRTAITANVTDLSAQAAAKKLLSFAEVGKYHADNPGDLLDLKRTAAGMPVWSQAGYWVHIDKRPLQALVFLIEKGYKIGTYAICSDHHYDGPHGHSGGLAVDISSINGVSVASQSSTSRSNTLALAKLLNSGMPSGLHPWQLICDGYGYLHNSSISAYTIPGAWYYGYTTMSQHRNHVHLGYYK